MTWQPRVMWWSNFLETRSGYGIVSKYVCNILHQAGIPVAQTPNYPWGPGTSLDVDGIPIFAGAPDTALYWAAENAEHWGATVLTPLYDLWAIRDYAQVHQRLKGKCLLAPYFPADTEELNPPLKRLLMDHTDYAIAMSDHGANLCRKAGMDNVTRIWHGVDTDRFRPWVGQMDPDLHRPITLADVRAKVGHSEDEFMIFMNFMNKGIRKMIPENLEGVKLFQEANPDVKVRVHMHTMPMLQDGWDLYAIVERLGLKEHVAFTKPYDVFQGIPFVNLAALYSAANVTLFSSGTEGFGLGAIESMSCGTPVIVTDYAAQTELVKPVAPELVVKPKALHWQPLQERFAIPDPEGICKALEKVLNSPVDHYKTRLVEHARKNFAWSVLEPQWIDFYTKTLPDFVDKKCLDIPDSTWAAGEVKTWA